VTRRLAAAVMLLAAVGLHLGFATPARRQRDEGRAEFARLREERERLRAQAARLQRGAVSVGAPSSDAEAVRELRRSFLGAVEGLPLRAVRISAEAGRRGVVVAVRGRLAAEGGQTDLLRAAGKLAEASSGVLLEKVRLGQGPGGDLRLDIEALGVRSPADVPTSAFPGQAPADVPTSAFPGQAPADVPTSAFPGQAPARRPAGPAGIRDVFRFDDEPPPAGHREPAVALVDGGRAVAPAPVGPRLVGLVQRAGRLMAALSVDGEVELAGPGDSAGGVTVLSVGEEGVHVRRADGSEEILTLP
jgi:hypothetical protein